MTTSWTSRPFVSLDVETTGLKADRDRVIEVGLVHFDGGKVVERYGQLVDPGCDVPEEVVQLTGIRPEDLVGKPRFEEIAEEVRKRLSGGIVVAYNLTFDKSFVASELTRAALQWPDDALELDPLVFVRQLHRGQGSKKLGAVAERLGINLENAHRAVDDAEVAGKVLLSLASGLPGDLNELIELQRQWEILQAQEQMRWRRNRSNSSGLLDSEPGGPALSREADEGLPTLGPAYIWGDETDPMKALFRTLPEVGLRRG